MRREAMVFGGFILVLGVFGIVNGSAILIRGAIHVEGTSCKAICGILLLLLLAELFTPEFGAAAAGAIYLLLGFSLALAGYFLLRGRQRGRP